MFKKTSTSINLGDILKMGTNLIPILHLKPSSFTQQQQSFHLQKATRKIDKDHRSIVPVARLFGPAAFEASKLKVLFLGVEKTTHPAIFPRTYTLTHSDITSKLTLAISQTINISQFQGWYNRLQRDEVVAEWKKTKGEMALHVHCHISGGHFLLDIFACLRYYIFSKELPVVLRAFVHGDEELLNNYPELQDALVWVYFHSNTPEYDKLECWGPLKAALISSGYDAPDEKFQTSPEPCPEPCSCCFPPANPNKTKSSR